jgi:small subunit ribosomal protein S2
MMVEKKIYKKKTEDYYKNTSRTLVNVDLYLRNGIHIGTKYKNGPMRRFIFKSRSDKLNVMDVQFIDQRIKIAIDFLLRYDPKDVIFISRKKYSLPGLKVLEKTFGYKNIVNRFVPGTFTNPQREGFIEPKLIFISDPNIDRQAIVEAAKVSIPIIALSTTSSNIRNIDFVIPFNNKGRKSVALFFWLLNKELQLRTGIIKSDKEYTYSVEDFLYKTDKKDSKSRNNLDRRTQTRTNRFGNRPDSRNSRFSSNNNYRNTNTSDNN